MHLSQKQTFTLGIYGDGQLSRLTAARAREAGLTVLIYTLNIATSPCFGSFPLFEGKSWDDEGSFERFSYLCDVIVLENEFVPPAFLLKAEKAGLEVLPNATAYEAVSDKWRQTVLAQGLGLQVPKYKIVKDPTFLTHIDYPCMLKALRGGYDGYGNFALKSANQLEEAKAFVFSRGPVIVQEFIDFDMEVAVIVARDGNSTQVFPVVETIQEKNICHFVLTPPRLDQDIQLEIQENARALIEAIDGVGVFGVEFFLRRDEIIFNEIAPRPHNSGHFSIEACEQSQFEALVNIAMGIPLKSSRLKVPMAGMLNILGNRNEKAHFEGDERFFSHPDGKLHLYGKKESRMGRKMGHFTLLGKNRENVFSELKDLKERYLT